MSSFNTQHPFFSPWFSMKKGTHFVACSPPVPTACPLCEAGSRRVVRSVTPVHRVPLSPVLSDLWLQGVKYGVTDDCPPCTFCLVYLVPGVWGKGCPQQKKCLIELDIVNELFVSFLVWRYLWPSFWLGDLEILSICLLYSF